MAGKRSGSSGKSKGKKRPVGSENSNNGKQGKSKGKEIPVGSENSNNGTQGFGGKKKGVKPWMTLSSQYKASLRLGANSPWAKLRPSGDEVGPTPKSKNPFTRPESDADTWTEKDKIAYDKWIKMESTIRKLRPEEAEYFQQD